MTQIKNVLLIHGPNLNLLGERERDIYGDDTLESINEELMTLAEEVGLELRVVQSNHEGEIVDHIQSARNDTNCIIINPAAFTHYSVAIRDALAGIDVPVIEVHLSNIYAREGFRAKSVIAPVVNGQVSGFGRLSYTMALRAAVALLQE